METANGSLENRSQINELLPYIVWTIAFVSSAGSLFLSEVMDLPPCVLCWYQRIAMYPLVFIIAVGIVLKDALWKWYALPFAAAGLLLAVYHNLLYYGIIPEDLTPCTEGISCTARQLELFGFITIPMLSLISFAVMLAGILLCRPARDV